jgi:hypothetical protein
MKRLWIFAIGLALFAAQAACNLPALQPERSPTPGQAPTALPTPALPPLETPLPSPTSQPLETSLNLEQLKNASYFLEDFNIQLRLVDGAFSNGQIQVNLVGPAAFGDLDGDGQEDAAVLLTIDAGGTGTFYHLFALLNQGGQPLQAGAAYVGDRQLVNELYISNGRILLDHQTHGLSSPLCCPDEHRLTGFVLEKGRLRRTSEQVLDSPQAQATPVPVLIFIDQPADSDPLTSPLVVRGRISQVPPERILEYYVVDAAAVLLDRGEIPLVGDPGGPGTFLFELSLEDVSTGLIQLELVDAADGLLRGRAAVILIAP